MQNKSQYDYEKICNKYIYILDLIVPSILLHLIFVDFIDDNQRIRNDTFDVYGICHNNLIFDMVSIVVDVDHVKVVLSLHRTEPRAHIFP